MNRKSLIEIETSRLRLAPPELKDVACYDSAILASMAVLQPWTGWANPSTFQKGVLAQGHIKQSIACQNQEQPNNLFWVIREKNSDEFIGEVYFGTIDWSIPYFAIGYWVDSRKSGQGYITEAANALTRVGFEYLLAKRIEISMSIDNIQSKKIPEKLGFIFEGELKYRHINFVTNKISSTLMYARYSLNELPSLPLNVK